VSRSWDATELNLHGLDTHLSRARPPPPSWPRADSQSPPGQSLAPVASHSPRRATRGILALLAVPADTGKPGVASQVGETLPAVVLGARATDLTALEHAEIGAAAVAIECTSLPVHHAAGHPRHGEAADAEDPVPPSVALAGVRAARAQRQPVAGTGAGVGAGGDRDVSAIAAVPTFQLTAAVLVVLSAVSAFVATAIEWAIVGVAIVITVDRAPAVTSALAGVVTGTTKAGLCPGRQRSPRARARQGPLWTRPASAWPPASYGSRRQSAPGGRNAARLWPSSSALGCHRSETGHGPPCTARHLPAYCLTRHDPCPYEQCSVIVHGPVGLRWDGSHRPALTGVGTGSLDIVAKIRAPSAVLRAWHQRC
jgi:hypothetical protein